ncbi:hypothetical protein QQP08_024567 [Theobroma cacao]|nr:hypothetical protein QQP08_024567 [Theobroma cacao]
MEPEKTTGSRSALVIMDPLIRSFNVNAECLRIEIFGAQERTFKKLYGSGGLPKDDLRGRLPAFVCVNLASSLVLRPTPFTTLAPPPPKKGKKVAKFHQEQLDFAAIFSAQKTEGDWLYV